MNRSATGGATRLCVVLLPYDNEVGAGIETAPSTTLASLGPDTGATPATCRVPLPSQHDAANGENPNRRAVSTTIPGASSSPSPRRTTTPRICNLGSLEANGIDISAHDVRSWKTTGRARTLWRLGPGWEIWIDGIEVTQFTYIQQVGVFRRATPRCPWRSPTAWSASPLRPGRRQHVTTSCGPARRRRGVHLRRRVRENRARVIRVQLRGGSEQPSSSSRSSPIARWSACAP